ncbi:MAG: response regulator [Lachnospiraceae bacterium]|nr:response regulator [Lachnospiraceae bacterium]
MENNLLFINQNKDIIQEFLAAMEGKEEPMAIDTADSGLEAAFLLKKKIYKVVVTGLDLPTYDGTKIVEFLNRNYPQTVCIVYTWRLELAHLKLLINERRVFRIFQRPMDYSQMYEAILDGFVLYDKEEADRLDQRELERTLQELSGEVARKKQLAKGRPWERSELAKFLSALLSVFIRDVKSEMHAREKWQLVRYEKKLILWFLNRQGDVLKNLEDVREDIYQRFQRPDQGQTVEVVLSNVPESIDPDFCGDLHFLSWLLLTRFTMFSSGFTAKVSFILLNQNRFRVSVEGMFPEGMWGAAHENKTSQMITGVTQSVLESFSDRFIQSIEDEKVVYYMEVQN